MFATETCLEGLSLKESVAGESMAADLRMLGSTELLMFLSVPGASLIGLFKFLSLESFSVSVKL